MRIGVILGIVMILIIGLFLSKRTNHKEPKLSPLVLPESGTQQRKTEEVILEGIPEEKIENSQIMEKPLITEVLQYEEKSGKIDQSQIAEKIIYDVEDEVTLPVFEQREVSVDISTKTIHMVEPNDSLTKIAKKYFGDETKWDKIFEANKDNMSNPHSLYVGQELLIPDVTVDKAETQAFRVPVKKKQELDTKVNIITHTVQSGDTLYRIAGKYYDDPAMWKEIYEANEEAIEGQGLLRKGQILIIPQ